MTGEIKERLLLNHLVVAQNVFGIEACTRMLFLSLFQEYKTYKIEHLKSGSQKVIKIKQQLIR